ncbi:MAG: lysozyme inhibitor LprI family protein [Chthoniobacterales bacterium]
MKSSFTLVVIVGCAISCGSWVLAANEEPVAAERLSEEPSPPVATPSAQSSSTTAQAEEKPQVLYTSPTGAFRILRANATPTSDDESGQEFWIVSTRDESQRTKLYSTEITFPTAFYSAPGERWLFVESHQGSCLQRGDLYRRKDDDTFEATSSFSDRAWKDAVKLGAFKTNYSAEGMCAMIRFGCWSSDASRFLVVMLGGEDRRSTDERYFYFNTRANKFELTDYLRKLNKTKSEMLACAEPVDSLPSEAEQKSRFDALDRQLNKRYAEVIAKMDKDQVSNVRDGQRSWIKHRDEGAKFYVSLFPPAEKERRRLQFLCDVTAARIETQPDEAWEE